MSNSSGPGHPNDRPWTAEYWFRGQPGVPGISGLSDVRGWTAADSFERLAAHLMADAARRWWSIEVPSEVADFGEILLRHARQIAEARGQWNYAPTARQKWANVTVCYSPIGR